MLDVSVRSGECFRANITDLPSVVEVRQSGVIDLAKHTWRADDPATDLIHKCGSKMVVVCVRDDADGAWRSPNLVCRIGHVTKCSRLVREIDIYGSFLIADCESGVPDEPNLEVGL